jgi:hypothetical protein
MGIDTVEAGKWRVRGLEEGGDGGLVLLGRDVELTIDVRGDCGGD